MGALSPTLDPIDQNTKESNTNREREPLTETQTADSQSSASLCFWCKDVMLGSRIKCAQEWCGRSGAGWHHPHCAFDAGFSYSTPTRWICLQCDHKALYVYGKSGLSVDAFVGRS